MVISLFLHEFYQELSFTFISLFAVINPFSLSPFFLSLTQGLDKKTRAHLAIRVAVYSFLLLFFVYLAGSHVLIFFGISLPALQMAGGIVIFFSAWKLLTSPSLQIQLEASSDLETNGEDLAFYPLTLPITVGAGSMSILMAIAAQQSEQSGITIIASRTGSIVGILLECLLIAIAYALSEKIYQKLGRVGAEIVTRLTSFILLAIALTLAFNGGVALVKSLL